MKKEINKLELFVTPSAEYTNLAMNENHQINWNDKLTNELTNIHQQYAYTQYGDSAFTALKGAYAQYMQVLPENLLVTSGSESLIGVLVQSLVKEKMLLFAPDFFRFREFADVHNKHVITYDIKSGIDIDAVIKTINQEQIELLIFSNPNNPLGTMLAQEDIIQILEQTAAYIVCDEAYGEFASMTMTPYINQYPNLIIMRTMSKAWGLPGLRIGYAIANPELIIYLTKALGQFNISPLVTEIAATVISQHKEYMQEVLADIITLRDDWVQKLQHQYNFKVRKSATNFINIETTEACEIASFLDENKLSIVCFPPDMLRISIGSPAEMVELEQLLDKYMELHHIG